MRDTTKTDPNNDFGIKKTGLVGGWILILSLVGFVVWAATAPIGGAAMAPGKIVTESREKTIEHMQGGVVEQIAVDEGQQVEEGDLLLAFDDTEAKARYRKARQALDSAIARRARLIAERRGMKDVVFPAELRDRSNKSESAASAMKAERRRFQERRNAQQAKIRLEQRTIADLNQKIASLKAKRDGAQRQVALLDEELDGLETLVENGHYERLKFMGKERDRARLDAKAAALKAQIDRTRQQIEKARSKIDQIQETFQKEVAKGLAKTRERINELSQELVRREQRLARMTVHAPHSGIVQDISVRTAGGVVQPGDTMMKIVPVDETLVVRGRIAPRDIDSVEEGQTTKVRMNGLSGSKTPVLEGKLAYVSANRIEPGKRDTQPYYVGRVVIDLSDQDKVEPERLQAGMPAKVIVKTGEQTVLSYILRPIMDAISTSFT